MDYYSLNQDKIKNGSPFELLMISNMLPSTFLNSVHICGFIYCVLCSLLRIVNRKGVGISADTSALPKEFSCSHLPYTLLGYEEYPITYYGATVPFLAT